MVQQEADEVEEVEDIRKASKEGTIECSSVRITNKKIIIICIYRPPRGDFNVFFETVSYILHLCHRKYKNHRIILCGDFNINLFGESANKKAFLDILTSYNLSQTINEGTRGEKSLIDNIFVDLCSDRHTGVLLRNALSDHHGQLLFMNIPETKTKNVKNWSMRMIQSEKRLNSMKQELLNETWDEVLASESADASYGAFIKRINELSRSIFVKKKVMRRGTWITNEIRMSCSTKRQLYDLKCKGLISKEFFYRYANDLRKIIKETKRASNIREIANAKNKNKAIWNVISRHTGRQKKTKSNIVNNLRGAAESSRDVLNGVNSFFINCAGEVNKNGVKPPKTITRNERSIFLTPTSCEEVRGVILSLKNTLAVGEDQVTVKLLKYIAESIQEPLTHIINLILTTGKFPEQLKIAEIRPIHKKGSKSSVSNYRPIALLSNISKIVEKVIYKRLINFFEKNNILNENQNGFRSGRSTIRAAYQAVCDIVESQNKNKKTALVCLDLSKAFDSVEYDLLLQKLEKYGIRGVSLNLIESYIKFRKQKIIEYDETGKKIESNLEFVKRGVPQGSVLGPLLYLIYTNDLPSALNRRMVQYADDTSLIFSEASLSELSLDIDSSLNILNNWFSYNNLKLNVDKTSIIKFDYKDSGMVLSLSNDSACERSALFLGMTIDSRLDWREHVSVMSNSLSRYCYAIGTVADMVGRDAALIAYYSLVESRLRYGIILWINSSETDRLFVVQKRILRRILKLNQRESCREHFKGNKVLTLYSLSILEGIMFAAKNYDLFVNNKYDHHYETRNRNDLRTDQLKFTYLQKNVKNFVITVYNKLPLCWKSFPEKTLRKKIKIILQTKAYYSINEFICDNSVFE